MALGNCYLQGQGVERDPVKAAEWFRRAAEQADSMGEFSLAVAYELGRGVTADAAEAVRWYRRAAEQGYVLAQYKPSASPAWRAAAGRRTSPRRQGGSPQRPSRALRRPSWPRKRLLNGQGLAADRERARECFRRAAEMGLPAASEALRTHFGEPCRARASGRLGEMSGSGGARRRSALPRGRLGAGAAGSAPWRCGPCGRPRWRVRA